jgi:aspartyl-tRNA(Asn)/glutamyl-tRNA(Gln) amidotransferase subunit A
MVSEIYTYRNNMPDLPVNNGPLSGKRVVVQPNMSVRRWITDASSMALEGFIALDDATVIARLRNAGAVLIGSSRMSELGFGLFGDTGARALSSGEADIALITDTMGEARAAASASGVFGFKPSFGIVSRFGLTGLVPSMECYGIMAQKLEDIIDAVGIIAGKDENDFSMSDEIFPDFAAVGKPLKMPCTLGVLKECLNILDEREMKAFRAGLARLEEAGFAVQETSLEAFHLSRGVHNVIASVEASSSAGKYDSVRYGHRCSAAKNWNDMYLNSRGESFGTLIKTFLYQGAYFQFENFHSFENACRIRRRLVRDTVSLFEHIDVLAFPVRRLQHDAAHAVTVNDTYDAFLLTLPANITGQPSLQIPFVAVDSGVDLGLQLTGLRLDDARLLSVGLKLSSIL